MGQMDMRADSMDSTSDPGMGHASWGELTDATTGRSEAAVARVLDAWRAVERQLEEMVEGTPEWTRARDEVARLRDEYHHRVDHLRSGE